MAKTSENLHKAKIAKKDEFYTQFSDIENELSHYKAHFKNKVVYCNCDDPLASNFFKYFFLNFKYLKLKELITTCYKSQNFREFSAEDSPKKAYAIKITRDCKVDTVGDSSELLAEIEKLLSLSLSDNPVQSRETIEAFEKNKHKLKSKTTPLKADKTQNKGQSLLPIFEDKDLDNAGDFRSQDCIELLKQSDIVVTNPPFSLFREYVSQLVEYNKKFVIIGHQNAISYKEIFKLIKDNKLWLGIGFKGGAGHFINVHYEDYATAGNHIDGMIRVSGVNWFTNLDIKKRHEILETIQSYNKTPEKYPKYDNYDAINVDKTNEIPTDYDGVMGVPITFLDKYNPEQFEIVALGNSRDNFTPTKDYINPKKHLKNGSIVNGGAINCVLTLETDKLPLNQIYYTSENSRYLLPPYARILIQKRKDK